MRLFYSCQVDGPGNYVDVHQVVDNPALNVALVFVDYHFFTFYGEKLYVLNIEQTTKGIIVPTCVVNFHEAEICL